MTRHSWALQPFALLVAAISLAPWASVRAARVHSRTGTPAASSISRVGELGFEVNRGQAAAPVRFLAPGRRGTLFLTASSLVTRTLGARPATARLRFVGIGPHARITPSKLLPARVSYFLGHDSRFWYRNISTYARVEYHNLYPGIDLLLDRRPGGIQDEWLLQPDARLGEIRMQLSGTGSESRRLALLGSGLVFRRVAGGRRGIPVRLVVRHAVVTLALDRRPPRALRPDFSLGYSTYLGGSSFDFATSVAVDLAGNAYVVGSTASPDFPTRHAVARNLNQGGDGEDAFVAKLSPTGALLYATYLGGAGDDEATGVAVEAGSAYVTGFTPSADFPTVRPLPAAADGRCGPTAAAGGSAFVTKLNATGSALTFSTCLGHHGTSWAGGIAVRRGHVYVAGSTTARDFPLVHAGQRRNAGGIDAFVAELNRRGNRLRYSTYLGGGGDEQGAGIAVDAAGNMYVTGSTNSTNFPTRDGIQGKFAGGSGETGTGDAFVTKLSPAGHIVYSTYLGGTLDDKGTAIAADGAGNAYLTGITASTDFPISHPLQSHNLGGDDAFVAKIDPLGSRLVYSTYLGGSGNDGGHGIAIDKQGNVSVTGSSASPNFPVAHPLAAGYKGGVYYGDAFVAQLNPAGDALNFSTYLGGQADDVGMGIAVGRAGAIYTVGGTSSRDFPTKHALSKRPPLRGNAWVIRIVEIGG